MSTFFSQWIYQASWFRVAVYDAEYAVAPSTPNSRGYSGWIRTTARFGYEWLGLEKLAESVEAQSVESPFAGMEVRVCEYPESECVIVWIATRDALGHQVNIMRQESAVWSVFGTEKARYRWAENSTAYCFGPDRDSAIAVAKANEMAYAAFSKEKFAPRREMEKKFPPISFRK